jgi:hypothetical protein
MERLCAGYTECGNPIEGRSAMTSSDRMEVARDCYRAYERSDRELLERHLAPDFMFYSPADSGIDRTLYFERCWPNAELISGFSFRRLAPAGDEVIVTYEATRTDGTRFCNTEVLTFKGDQVARAEVYFGWELPAAAGQRGGG